MLEQSTIVWVRRTRIQRALHGKAAVLAVLQDCAGDRLRGIKADRIVIEGQEVYPGGRFSADLLNLSLVSGGLAALFMAFGISTDIRIPLPREWKGQVPKPIHHARVRTKLSNPEAFDKLTEDERDAVALAMWGQN